ncbi:MAG TPA: glycoside hydrolase family 172 protein [Cyclobacteriaceae bacterium]
MICLIEPLDKYLVPYTLKPISSLRLIAISIILIFLSNSCQEKPKDVTMATLLEEMTNRESLARFPFYDFETKQFSSYDRLADTPGVKNWFANQDRTNFLRKETTENGSEWVMFDSRQPGAIVRWWMTFAGEGAGDGTLRIYIDGSENPIIEGSAYDVMSGGILAERPLSASISKTTVYKRRGHNLYLPIPYNSCKITYQGEGIKENEAGEILEESVAIYYNINYRQFVEGISVESFNTNTLHQYLPEIYAAQTALHDPYSEFFTEPAEETMKLRKLNVSESFELKLVGERQIKSFSMKLQAQNQSQALRSTIISISFDGNKTITMPVGDFFGTGYEINPYETYYSKVFYDGTMAAFWPMPFRKEAVIEVTNHGEQDVTISDLEIYTGDWHWDERSMYFSGTWKQWYDKPTGGGDDPEDLNFVTIQGQGVYVGDLITLYNNKAAWWGEGDEKIYVDGEDFPSHFGTGTEDYYGYAWSRPEFFEHPFIAQPDGSGNLEKGTAVNIRFRALDKIPFDQKLQMDMELWHWTQTSIDYAPTTFYYVKPSAQVQHTFEVAQVKKKVRFAPDERLLSTFEMVNLSIQGEKMELVRLDRGKMFPRSHANWDWEEDTHMVWWDAQVGDVALLRFSSTQAISGANVELQLTQSKNYGKVDLSINDSQNIVFDGYAPKIRVTQLNIKGIDINNGWNTLKVEVTGKNDKATNHVFGIDYLKIKN